MAKTSGILLDDDWDSGSATNPRLDRPNWTEFLFRFQLLRIKLYVALFPRVKAEPPLDVVLAYCLSEVAGGNV